METPRREISRERIIKCCAEAYDYAERSKQTKDRKDKVLYCQAAIVKLTSAVDAFVELTTPEAKILQFPSMKGG